MRFLLLTYLCLATLLSARNHIANASFENSTEGSTPPSWSFDSGRAHATGVLTSEEAHTGAYSFKISNPSAYGPHIFGALTQRLNGLKADTPYTFSFYVKSAAPSVMWFGGGDKWRHRAVVNFKSKDWFRVTATFTMKKEDLPYMFRINTDSPTTATYIDDIQVEEGTQATDFQWIAPLKPGEAILSLTPFKPAENLLSNPSFETVSAVRPQDWYFDKRNTDSTFEIISSGAADGSKAVRITNGTGFGAHVYCWFGHQGDIPVKPDTIYTISLNARTTEDNTSWFGGGVGWLHRKFIPATNGEWRRVVFEFRTRADETLFPFMIVSERETKQLDIDDIIFTEGRQPDITWKPNAPEDVAHFTPPEPERIPYRNGTVLPYYAPSLYPMDQWLFTSGELKFTGFVGLAKPEAGAKVVADILDDSGKSLASSTMPLDTQDGAQAWLADLTFNPGPTNSTQLHVQCTVTRGGIKLHQSINAINIVTPARVSDYARKLTARNMALKASLEKIPTLPTPSRLHLSTIVADRFLGYIPGDIRSQQINRAWFTLDKLSALLDDAEREAADIIAGKRPLPPVIPQYQTSPIKIDHKTFLATVRQPDGSLQQDQPVFFTGYGHFNQVRDDLEIFPQYGVNVIQVEHGPNGVVLPDGGIDLTAFQGFANVCKRAAKANVSVCLLISPHYFPNWALDKYPHLKDCTGGFFKYCVHAPEARDILERYLRAIIPVVKDLPALHSICMTNEPLSLDSTKCQFVRRDWAKWLQSRHGTIEKLNNSWGSKYATFADIPVPPPHANGKKCTPLEYDFILFNQETFAGFHKWMADIIHSMAPSLPVHAKIMMSPFFGYNSSGIWSIDPQLFSELSDINGNDHCCFPSNSPIWYNGWHRYLMGYDFQGSMKDVPVFNTEDHIISDRDYQDRLPMHTYSAHIQGAIHGQGATTMWVWERTNNPTHDFAGSVLHRPLHVMAVSQSAMDLMRLAPEVRALQNRRPQIALVWSQSSMLLNESTHLRELDRAWQALAFQDQSAAFLTERQLATIAQTEKLPEQFSELKVVVLPSVTHLPQAARQGLEVLLKQGRQVVTLGKAVAFDEYGHPLGKVASDMPSLPENAQERMTAMQKLLAAWGLNSSVLALDDTNHPAFGVQVRSVTLGGRMLVNLCNQTRKPVTVHLSLPGQTKDLLTLTTQDNIITLPPIQPFILEKQP